jgi:parallel beta-helix repeat protein
MDCGRSLIMSITCCLLAFPQTRLPPGQLGQRRLITGITLFGAVGDGITDDTAALQTAIDRLPANSTLNFGGSDKTYLISHSLQLQPDESYIGQATIRMSKSAPSGTEIAFLSYQMADNVTISGLTLDGNGVGGGISIAVNGGADVPAHNISITQVTFMNTNANPQGGGDNAIYDPVGLTGGVISNNAFINCGGGILISDPGNVTISQNQFTTILQQDAIYLLFPQNPFPYGTGLVVSNNRGSQIGRIGIEMWGPGGGAVQAPVITNNVFQGWSNKSYGISVVVGTQAQITNNSLLNGSGPFGIELGAPFSTVKSNTINGFATGIVAEGSHDSVIDSNILSQQSDTGIQLSNAPGLITNLQVTNNQILDPQFKGLSTQAGNYANSTISGNSITRHLGVWSADSIQTEFQALSLYPPNGPIAIMGNTIVEDGEVILGFRFVGVEVNGSQNANHGTVYDSNKITSNLPQPSGIGIYVNSGGGLDNVTLTNNTFQNLAIVTSGGPSPGVNSQNNVAINCAQIGPIAIVQ